MLNLPQESTFFSYSDVNYSDWIRHARRANFAGASTDMLLADYCVSINPQAAG
jgi:hypothetical protein